MTRYAQKYSTDLQSTNDSLIVAFCNLLDSLGHAGDPETLAKTLEGKELDWDSVTEWDDMVYPIQIGEYGSWPDVKNAIVKFRCMSQRTGEPVDHYCLIADPESQTIIDSLDGRTKSPGSYGNPTGWAAYVVEQDIEDTAAEQDPTLDTTRYYKVLGGGENAWAIAKKLGIQGKELIEHNDLKSADVPGGTVLHLPVPIEPAKKPRTIKYEVFPRPLQMHVIKEGGTRKYAFANAKRIEDLQHSGPGYAENANVEIVAVAYVPMGELDTYAYYMEHTALGDYEKTGRIAFAVGFNHTHLDDGHVEQVKPAPKPELQQQLKAAEAAISAPQAVVDAEPEQVSYNAWKTTYTAFHDGPKVYLANQNLIVHDYEGKRPDRPLYRLKGIVITGTFWKDNVKYGRPKRGEGSGHWYGIDMDDLTLEDEIFNTEIDLPTRVASRGRLSVQERYITVPLARTLTQSTRLAGFLKQKIKEK